MEDIRTTLIERIFAKQDADGFWKRPPAGHPRRAYVHYAPTFRASLWCLVYLADLKCPPHDPRVSATLAALQDQFFDGEHGIYSLREDHFPIPCLNGNMIYLDAYFRDELDPRTERALQFFARYQRFDDGTYDRPPSVFCQNKSCYGAHTCYWGIVKLLKGISFIPTALRNDQVQQLRRACIDFVLLHQAIYSSRREGRFLTRKIDQLTFPNMYRSDLLEILWIMQRENVRAPQLADPLQLLRSKQLPDGQWPLEYAHANLITSPGPVNRPNAFVSERARQVLTYYAQAA